MTEELLEFTAGMINKAIRPEEVFGGLVGEADQLAAASLIYRRLSKVVHPNAYSINTPDQKTAEEAFKRLSQLMEEAKLRLQNGTYGQIEAMVLRSRRREYQVFSQLYPTDFCRVFQCSYQEGGSTIAAHLKIARDPSDNDKVSNEQRVLGKLVEADQYDKFSSYFPTLTDSFTFIDKDDKKSRQANIFSVSGDKFYSLKEIKEQYRDGIDPKDMAWMWRRLLVGLGFAHASGMVHGATLPHNIFIQPEKHGLIINEWAYAVVDPITSGERISALNSDYEDWYPSEVKRKDIPTPALDIYMGAKCMDYLLPVSTDLSLKAFLEGCMLVDPSRRPQEAWGLLEEFDYLIANLWGPRKFHPFSMPKKTERR